MKIQASIARRSVLAAAAALLLAGCSAPANAGSAPTAPAEVSPAAWTARLDADAPILNVKGEEGAAMPGECWAVLEDGTIQVQIAGSSMPEPEVGGVDFADGILTLTMVQPEEGTPATMDFILHQFMVAPGDDAKVTGVVLVRGEESAELPAGVVVEEAE